MAPRKKTIANHQRFSHFDIVVRDNEQEECLEATKRKGIYIRCCLYLPILNKLGVSDELPKIIRLMK